MQDHLHSPDALEFISAVEHAYQDLMAKARAADVESWASEPGLGGRLFYAGELDQQGRALVVAGNISGAATLCATADVLAQKQAVRDGVIDFLVTSLDEAVRILKNQVRKRETAAVCVGTVPSAVEAEMTERGVHPDMQRADVGSELSTENRGKLLVVWSLEAAPVRWMPKLDALALDCVDANDAIARRWIRLAPKYLGRAGQAIHLVHGTREVAERFTERVREQVERGEIAAEVRIAIRGGAASEERSFAPSQ